MCLADKAEAKERAAAEACAYLKCTPAVASYLIDEGRDQQWTRRTNHGLELDATFLDRLKNTLQKSKAAPEGYVYRDRLAQNIEVPYTELGKFMRKHHIAIDTEKDEAVVARVFGRPGGVEYEVAYAPRIVRMVTWARGFDPEF